MTEQALTDKQQRFIEEYLVDLNGSAAAIRAGYSKGSAGVEANRLLKNAKIAAAIKQAMDARSERTQVKADQVVKEYARIAFADPRKVMAWGPDGVKLLPSSELSDDAAAMVAEVSETTTEHGGSLRLKLHNKLGALDSIARHLGMFIDRTEVSVKHTFVDALRELERYRREHAALGTSVAEIAEQPAPVRH